MVYLASNKVDFVCLPINFFADLKNHNLMITKRGLFKSKFVINSKIKST